MTAHIACDASADSVSASFSLPLYDRRTNPGSVFNRDHV